MARNTDRDLRSRWDRRNYKRGVIRQQIIENHDVGSHEVMDLQPMLKALFQPKAYISHARWPADVYTGIDGTSISKDKHGTPEEAHAVCERLKRDGFGGEGKHFPISTWVLEVEASEADSLL